MARACRLAETSGFEFGHWDTAGKAVVKAMLYGGALLAPTGEPIVPDISAQATPVAALKDRYQDVTRDSFYAC